MVRRVRRYSIALNRIFTIIRIERSRSGYAGAGRDAMNSFAKNSLLNNSAQFGAGAKSTAPVRLPKKFNLRDAHFDELELRLEEDRKILWCDMRPSGRPSYTREVMAGIGAVQAAVRQMFADRKEDEDRPFNYCVCGSHTRGIYNLEADLAHFIERIRDGDFESMR